MKIYLGAMHETQGINLENDDDDNGTCQDLSSLPPLPIPSVSFLILRNQQQHLTDPDNTGGLLRYIYHWWARVHGWCPDSWHRNITPPWKHSQNGQHTRLVHDVKTVLTMTALRNNDKEQCHPSRNLCFPHDHTAIGVDVLLDWSRTSSNVSPPWSVDRNSFLFL